MSSFQYVNDKLVEGVPNFLLIEEVEEISPLPCWKKCVSKCEFPGLSSESATLSGALTNRNEVHNGKLYGVDFTPEDSDFVCSTLVIFEKVRTILLYQPFHYKPQLLV